MLKSGEIIVAPGIGDALSAKIAAYAGIKALTMGGYSVSASRLGQPDVGFLSCTEMAEQLTGICNATDLPVVADGDTGYGKALNVIRTEQMFEQAGAACIFFEDQAWPKRCGHMDGKQVISAGEHAQKIRAAVDARLDKETMIMSRTDSRRLRHRRRHRKNKTLHRRRRRNLLRRRHRHQRRTRKIRQRTLRQRRLPRSQHDRRRQDTPHPGQRT